MERLVFGCLLKNFGILSRKAFVYKIVLKVDNS